MNNILKGILVLMTVSIVSCTNKESIEIAYQSNIAITAAHIFDAYEQFEEGDFNMTEDGWKLHLLALVYDENGNLVDKSEMLCDKLTQQMNYSPDLTPGKYTMVCIADFREGLGGKDFKFWHIENESSLQDLSITENDSYFPVVFETLGIDVQTIEVSNKMTSLVADIKPATCLVHVYMSDKDYSGWGLNGYSRFVAMSTGYIISSVKAKNNVRFENGGLSFKYSEQQSQYTLAVSRTHEKWYDNSAPTTYVYRALLPEENKGFSYYIKKQDIPDEDYETFLSFCGEFEVEGKSEVLPEIASNRQYVVNMIFDAMQLVAMEYPEDYDHETYTEQFVKDYNKQMMVKMVNTKYENILTKAENFANVFLDMDPYDHNAEFNPALAYYPRSKADHFELTVTLGYLDSEFNKCCLVQLLLPDLSDEMFEYLKELLGERFVAEEEGKYGPTYFTYIEPGKSEDDSMYRVALQKTYNSTYDKYNYFLTYNLRSKYY